MKILLIHNFYRTFGGEDKIVYELKEFLSNSGHKVYLYSRESESIDYNKKLAVFKDAYFSNTTIIEIDKIINEFKPDVAHIHNVFPLISPSIYEVLSKRQVPIVQTIHNYRFVCANGLMYNKGKTCRKCLDKKDFYQCGYNKCYQSSYIRSFWYADIIKKSYKRGLFDNINTFIVFNEFVKEVIVHSGVNPDKICIIPNGIDNGGYITKFIKEDYFVYIGRLSQEKGIMTLLKAMKEINEEKLIILGEGNLKERIRDYIKYNKMENIKLVGFKSGDEKAEIIAKAKAVIVPSEWFETFGLVVIEAFSLGTPVIASRIGSLKYLVEDNINGLTYEPGNYMDLRDKIKSLSDNCDLNIEMSKNAYEIYKEKYTSEIYINKIIDLYKKII